MKNALALFPKKAGESDEKKNLDLLGLFGGDFVPAGLYKGPSHG
jgi:hypothetical protein